MKKIYFALLVVCILIGCNATNKNNVITVGAILPLTGDWSNFGTQMANGIKLWEYQNPHSSIQLVYEDGVGSAKHSISALNKMIMSDGLDCCISGVSPVILSIAPIIDARDLFAINAGATNPNIKKVSKNIFSIIPDADVEASYIADFLIDSLGRSNCYVLWKNDDSGIGMLNTFKKRYKEKNGVVVGDEAIENVMNLKNMLYKVKSLGVNTIFIPTNGEMIVRVIQQARSMGIDNVLWVGYAAAMTPELNSLLSELEAPNFIFSGYSFNNVNKSDATKDFIKQYELLFNATPQYYSATCYDAIALISKAVEAGCKTSSQIKDYIYSLDSYDGVSGSFLIQNKNYVSSGMCFNMLHNGKISPINTKLFQ